MGQILLKCMKIEYTRTHQTYINVFLTQAVWCVCLCVDKWSICDGVTYLKPNSF